MRTASLSFFVTPVTRCRAIRRRVNVLEHSPSSYGRRWHSSGPGTEGSRSAASPLSAEEFASVAPMALLCQALRQHAKLSAISNGATGESHSVISHTLFEKYCHESHVKDPAKALLLLEKTGTVVSLSDGKGVHLRPAQFLHMYEDAIMGDKVSTNFFLDEANRRIEAARSEELAMREDLLPALNKAAKWRRLVWAGALCFAGLQLAVISRLTYFDLDWDVMEPVSYFLGTGTSIIFFLYFIRYGRSHTYTDFDTTMLPAKVKKFAPHDFDWDKYDKICHKVKEEENMAEKIREWVKRH